MGRCAKGKHLDVHSAHLCSFISNWRPRSGPVPVVPQWQRLCVRSRWTDRLEDQVSSFDGHLVAATLPTEATPAAQASSHPADPDNHQ